MHATLYTITTQPRTAAESAFMPRASSSSCWLVLVVLTDATSTLLVLILCFGGGVTGMRAGWESVWVWVTEMAVCFLRERRCQQCLQTVKRARFTPPHMPQIQPFSMVIERSLCVTVVCDFSKLVFLSSFPPFLLTSFGAKTFWFGAIATLLRKLRGFRSRILTFLRLSTDSKGDR